MKNQYFADINDFRKYSLLRILSDSRNMKIAICWMLTKDDGGSDGKFLSYINQPNKYRLIDPELFDILRECISSGERNVSSAERNKLIPGAVYFSNYLSDNHIERGKYFSEFREVIHDCDLVFFDPDNGLEIKSVSYGKKNSSKYLYWQEIKDVWSMGKSLLLYQHFPRIERSQFVLGLVNQMKSEIGAEQVIVYKTAKVLYCLIPQQAVVGHFSGKISKLIDLGIH